MADIKFMEPEEYEAYLAAQEQAVTAEKPIATNDNTEIQVSLYQLNRQLVAQMPDMTEEQLLFARESVKDWLAHNTDNYYMLLNNDLHYYTLFHCKSTYADEETYNGFWAELMDVFHSMGRGIHPQNGHLKIVEVDTNGMVACWATWDDGEDNLPHCFYLFPYGQGVVEV